MRSNTRQRKKAIWFIGNPAKLPLHDGTLHGKMGGVITRVSKLISHKVEVTFCSSDGQFLIHCTHSWISPLYNVYLRPAANADACLEELFDQEVQNRNTSSMVLHWNLNLESQDNPMIEAVSPTHGWLLAVSTNPGEFQPTRWKGKRALDYAITNLSCISYGDHIPLLCLVSAHKLALDNDDSHAVLRKVNFYKPPKHVKIHGVQP